MTRPLPIFDLSLLVFERRSLPPAKATTLGACAMILCCIVGGLHNVFDVSTNPPASSQPESPPFSENTSWYPIFWRLSAASAPRFPPAQYTRIWVERSGAI